MATVISSRLDSCEVNSKITPQNILPEMCVYLIGHCSASLDDAQCCCKS